MKMSDYEEAEIMEEVESEITISDEQENHSGLCERDNNSVLDDRDHKYVELTNVESKLKTMSNFVVKNIENENIGTSRHSSELWTKFTIISRKHQIASCNICRARLSFRSTTSNLRKHLWRKHIDSLKTHSTSCKPKFKQSPRPKLSELDSLILNVVGNQEEGPNVEFVAHKVEPCDVQNEVHDYCLVNEEEPSSKRSSTSRNAAINDRRERANRNRILDLQLECLEVKKYIMRMETLLTERQLNLPRSIYTENLRSCEYTTRGTQTDVAGINTKVFYITDYQESGMEGSHLFSFQTLLKE